MFASWDGGAVVASRPQATTTGSAESPPATDSPSSVRIDPATGAETPAGNVWLPAVDPTRSRAIVWNGSIERDPDGTTWAPQDGQLELRAWSTDGGGATASGETADDGRIASDELSRLRHPMGRDR